MVLESPRKELLAQRLSEFAAFCTDMGTEMSMVEFQLAGLETVIPPWAYSSFVADTELDDAPPPQDRWMPNALSIPGFLHIVHTIVAEINMGLE
eukprot:8703028-Alexandrium_andersonii.AAC.1